MSQSDKAFWRTIAEAFLLVSLFMWIVNTSSRLYVQNVLDNGIQTQAHVESIVRRGTVKIPVYSPKVTYPQADGPVVLRHITYMPNIGDDIEVVYHKDHPNWAVMAGLNAWEYTLSIQTVAMVLTPLASLICALISWSIPASKEEN